MTESDAGPRPVSADKVAAMEVLDAQLSLLWRRARAINYQLSHCVHPDLEPAAYGLLSVLLNEGGMRLTVLARCIGVGKPSVSRQIALLEALEFVRKETDPHDRRAQIIELTPTGREKMHSILAKRQVAVQQRLANWNEDELRTLATLIAKLNADYAR